MQHYFLVLLCAWFFFLNVPNCSGKVAWVNRIRKRFFLMVPHYRSGLCRTVDLPHFHPFASPSLIREIVITVYFPRQLCWLLITYQNLSNWKKCHRGNMRHNLVFRCVFYFLFMLRAKTHFWQLSCSAPSLINYLKKLLPSKVTFLIVFLVV